MTAQEYFDRYQNQSLLWAPSKAREYLRGQCVQAVCFYVSDNGFPVIWADAYPWFAGGLFSDRYERIANSPDAVPQPGDIIVWGPNTPGSAGAGHRAVCLQPRPGTGTFVSVDQNWGGKTVHLVTHNYNNVVGWLRLKRPAAPQPQPQGDEMIANGDQARDAYALLRGTRDSLSQAELDGTAGKRTWAGFAVDARPEIAARTANFNSANQRLADMSNTINSQNATITDLTTKLSDANVSNSDKQKALDEALAKLGSDNAELATLHDQITELQKAVPAEQVDESKPAPADNASPFAKLLAAILMRFKK